MPIDWFAVSFYAVFIGTAAGLLSLVYWLYKGVEAIIEARRPPEYRISRSVLEASETLLSARDRARTLLGDRYEAEVHEFRCQLYRAASERPDLPLATVAAMKIRAAQDGYAPLALKVAAAACDVLTANPHNPIPTESQQSAPRAAAQAQGGSP